MRILSDNEFLAMVADRGNPEEMNRAILDTASRRSYPVV